MKKLILSTSLFVSLCLSGGVYADSSVDLSVQVKGYVGTTCSIANTNTAAMDFGDLASSTGQLSEDAVLPQQTLGTITCNYPAHVSIKTTNGALKTGTSACAAATAAETNCVQYTAHLETVGLGLELNTNGNAGLTETDRASGPLSGPLDLAVTLTASTKPLIGGNYSDTLTIKIGAEM